MEEILQTLTSSCAGYDARSSARDPYEGFHHNLFCQNSCEDFESYLVLWSDAVYIFIFTQSFPDLHDNRGTSLVKESDYL